MNAILQTALADDTSPGFPGVSSGRSREGFPVALVGDNAFAMAPGRDGRRYLATGWRIARPLDEWTRSDFYGHSGELADEAAFRDRIEENALHQQQRAALDRREISSRAHTPWGTSQGATVHADGVVFHATASHGGFHLSPDRNAKVHSLLRAGTGWYEEDCHWAAVAHAFPELFTDSERASAESTICNWYPEAWEAIHGKVLQPGQSSAKDEREFYKRHADDWIVVSAIRSDHEPGLTEVVATMGGDRSGKRGTRRYLVPSEEYGTSGARFGFIIDETRLVSMTARRASSVGRGRRRRCTGKSLHSPSVGGPPTMTTRTTSWFGIRSSTRTSPAPTPGEEPSYFRSGRHRRRSARPPRRRHAAECRAALHAD